VKFWEVKNIKVMTGVLLGVRSKGGWRVQNYDKIWAMLRELGFGKKH
jgi:hypothetical protein